MRFIAVTTLTSQVRFILWNRFRQNTQLSIISFFINNLSSWIECVFFPWSNSYLMSDLSGTILQRFLSWQLWCMFLITIFVNYSIVVLTCICKDKHMYKSSHNQEWKINFPWYLISKSPFNPIEISFVIPDKF